MAGGLLNLIAVGNQNVIVHGDPQKTFFKVTYAKHSNFGLQKFRIDHQGIRFLSPTSETKFNFKIPKYGDLLMDTYIAVRMPTIWSPILSDGGDIFSHEFKWIKDLGTQMINEISISIGGQVIQQYSGEYIKCMVERDYSNEKKELFNKMTGNVEDMYNPGEEDMLFKYRAYPNNVRQRKPKEPGSEESEFDDTLTGHPSIMGRTLYIPLNAFWCMSSKTALPLVSLQYTDLEIDVTLKPVKDLYTIINTDRDISGSYIDDIWATMHWKQQKYFNYYTRVAPNYTTPQHQLKWFIYPSKRTSLHDDGNEALSKEDIANWNAQREDWKSDVHLISTYAFLSDEESDMFTETNHEILYKDIKKHTYQSVHGTSRVKIETSSLVSSWMFYFRRDDARDYNEWSNYTNHNYNTKLHKNRYLEAVDISMNKIEHSDKEDETTGIKWNGRDITSVLAGVPLVTRSYNAFAPKSILNTMGILMDGKYRENMFEVGIYDYLEKIRCGGNTCDGLYCYNFCLNTNPFDYQPSGAINLSKFKTVEFEFNTIEPPLNPTFTSMSVCAPGGGLTGISEKGSLYKYDYDLIVFEERYNVLEIKNGMASLMFSR
jgi:hypothetical protein